MSPMVRKWDHHNKHCTVWIPQYVGVRVSIYPVIVSNLATLTRYHEECSGSAKSLVRRAGAEKTLNSLAPGERSILCTRGDLLIQVCVPSKYAYVMHD